MAFTLRIIAFGTWLLESCNEVTSLSLQLPLGVGSVVGVCCYDPRDP